MKIVLWVVGVLQVVRPVFSQAYREDGLCGPENLAPSGGAAACQHIPPFPTCCQKNGHCGWDCDDVAPSLAVGSSIPRAPAPPSSTFKPAPVQSFTSNGKYRSDGKCEQGAPWRTGHQQSATQTRNTSAVLSLDFVAALRNIVTVTSVSTTDQSSS